MNFRHLQSDIESLSSYIQEIYNAYIEFGGQAYTISPKEHITDTADEVMVSLSHDFGLYFINWHHVDTFTFTITISYALANKLGFIHLDVAAKFMVEIGAGIAKGTYEHPLYFQIKSEEDLEAAAPAPSPNLTAHHAEPCSVRAELNALMSKQQQVYHDENKALEGVNSVSMSDWDEGI
jgi:prefoldin subunit 5